MNEQDVIELGDQLYSAMLEGSVVEPPAKRFTSITVDDAYRIFSRKQRARPRSAQR